MNSWHVRAIAIGLVLGCGLASSGFGVEPAIQRRKPVALIEQDGRLLVANAASGSISVVDLLDRMVVAEISVGRSLADLAILSGGGEWLALDEGKSQLVVLSGLGKIVERLNVAPGPVSLAISENGKLATVASKWARTLTVISLDRDASGLLKPKVARTIALPFNPRKQVVIRHRVIVADAFGGNLAVVDPGRGVIESVRKIQSHNIGGLSSSHDGTRLVLTQQYLNARAETKADDLHWGFLMTNSLRSIKLDPLLSPGVEIISGGRLDHFGEPGLGAGDPSGILALPDGRFLTALSGVNEVAIGPLEQPDEHRVKVGRMPTAVAASRNGRRVYVANTLDDSISVVDPTASAVIATISLGPTPELTSEDLGERLFFDATLSHEGWMSCQSCHTDGHASMVKADTLGDGSYGAPKRTLSLLGLADTGPYAWDGSVKSLDEQVRKSFQTTLRGKTPPSDQIRAVSAYLRTLAPPPPPLSDVEPSQIERGRAVFDRRRCDRCHVPPTYTSAKSLDVGLEDEVGSRLFNPPSLRGVSQRGALFHDGRARDLKEVFHRFGHPEDKAISREELADLVAFLRSL